MGGLILKKIMFRSMVLDVDMRKQKMTIFSCVIPLIIQTKESL